MQENLDKQLILKHKVAYERLLNARRVLLVTHVSPDGDALGSVCSFISLCESLNKEYYAFCADKNPETLSFLPNVHKIKNSKDFDFSVFDLIIVCDCGSIERTGIKEKIQEKQKNQFLIEIDHHPKMKDYADLEIRKTNAVSTTEIIYNFFKENKIYIDKNIATCILAGIMTDTFNFLHPHTTDVSLSIASEMMSKGAHFPLITKKTFYNKSLESMRLWGRVLGNLQINEKYNLAFTVLTKEETAEIKKDEHIFDAISGFLSSLEGVKGIMLLREEIDVGTGKIFLKGSLRSSHPTADISLLARKLGGGGHPKSSGFSVKGRFKKTSNSWKVI